MGTWWVGEMTVNTDEYGWPEYRSMTQDKLMDILDERYPHLPNTYLSLVPLNKGCIATYGVERWLSKLEYKINKEPEKYKELKELLMAGWNFECEVSTLSVLHVLKHDQPIDEIFKKLVTKREGLTRCLNTKTNRTHEERLKADAKKKVIRNMKKTGKIPKPSTLKKYDIDITSVLVSPV